MANNHFRVALRRALAEKSYVAVNVLTLALGLASFILIATYLRSELAYDRHHDDYRRIYRIVSDFTGPGGETHSAISSPVLGPLLVKEFPQLGTPVRIMRAPPEAMLAYADRARAWGNLFIADPRVFEVFRHRVLQGDPATALADPFSIAISERVARYYFGNENPLGKSFTVVGFAFKVTLVYADLPANTHLRHDALFSTGFVNLVMKGFNDTPVARLWSLEFGTYTYLKVPTAFRASEFPGLVASFTSKYMRERPSSAPEVRFGARLQPIADAHYGEKLQFDLPTGNPTYLWGFSGIAVFLLLTACINYMNLATARAARRSREVGMRKVLGANRGSLVRQFLTESLLLTLLALVVAVVLVEVTLPFTPVAELIGDDRLKLLAAEPDIVAWIVVLVIAVALLSGLYPAFHLSAMSPASAFSNGRRSWRTGLTLRQSLVAVQLGLSIGVIVGVALMMGQMRYIHDKPLGFEKHNRLIVQLLGADGARLLPVIKEELARLPGVTGVSRVSGFPLAVSGTGRLMTETTGGKMEQVQVVPLEVDAGIVDTLKLEIVAGRSFSADTATDEEQAVLVNEALVRRMGWSHPLGMRVSSAPNGTRRVIGVVKDFHYASLHNTVDPLVMFPYPAVDDLSRGTAMQNSVARRTLIVAISGRELEATLKRVGDVFEKSLPAFRFEPVFLEDEIDAFYKVESGLLKLAALFAVVCVALSVIGIAALSSFMTEQRAREIGVRKVLGASAGDILMMVCRPLPLLVLASAVPASLIAFQAMDAWLQRFPYRIQIDPAAFVGATLLIMFVALVTVAVQANRVLRADPAAVLRYE
jgi:putative ABC transport system permease protein